MKNQNKKDKTITALLAFFLGMWGIHRFYLNNIPLGILYLFTGGLCFIGVIADFIGFLIMSQEDFDRKYNPSFYYMNQESWISKHAAPTLGVADELLKLDQLWQAGVINFEEYEKQKAKLLSSN